MIFVINSAGECTRFFCHIAVLAGVALWLSEVVGCLCLRCGGEGGDVVLSGGVGAVHGGFLGGSSFDEATVGGPLDRRNRHSTDRVGGATNCSRGG